MGGEARRSEAEILADPMLARALRDHLRENGSRLWLGVAAETCGCGVKKVAGAVTGFRYLPGGIEVEVARQPDGRGGAWAHVSKVECTGVKVSSRRIEERIARLSAVVNSGSGAEPASGPDGYPEQVRFKAGGAVNPKVADARMTGKPDWGRIPVWVFEDLPAVMAHGDAKHGRDSWMRAAPWMVYASAALRHIFKWCAGRDVDEESGLHHLDHAAANLMILRWLILNRPSADDRPRPPAPTTPGISFRDDP